jgi:putative tryptophan/tyrosine transport system substrate-binding protein
VPDIRAATDALKQHLEVLTASTESELEAAFAIMVRDRVGAFIVMPDPLFISRREQLVKLAARHTMPGIYPIRVYPEIGGLMSYGSATEIYMNARRYMSEKSSRAPSRLIFRSNRVSRLNW